MTPDSLARLDQFIAETQRTLDDAKRIRDILVTNPALAGMLLGAESLPLPPATPTPIRRVGLHAPSHKGANGPTRVSGGPVTIKYYEAIKRYLILGQNAPRTIAEIVEGAGVDRNAVTHVLYRTHTTMFEKVVSEDGGREKFWQLRPDVYEREASPSVTEEPGEGPSE